MAIAALYPHAPQQQTQNALQGNPLSIIPAMIQARQFQSQQAVGKAFQGATGPDGSFDPGAAQSAIANDPNAALGAPEATTRLLANRRQNIDNSTAALGLGTANGQAIASAFAPLAQKSNPTMDDVYSAAALAARQGADPKQISGVIAGIKPGNIKQSIGDLANFSMGAGAASSRVTGPVGPNGEPTQTSTGAVIAGNPTLQTQQGPQQIANQSAYNSDLAASSETLKNMRPLQQALPLIQSLDASNFGKGSPELATLKGLLVTAGVMDPNSTSLPTRQEAQKYLNQFVSGLPHASDMGLTQDKISKPNFDITQPANIALIKNAIAMSRMDAAAPKAIGGAQDYLNKKSQYYNNMDPRAFQMDMMSPSEVDKMDKSLKGQERTKFVSSLKAGVSAGVISPPNQQGQ